MTSHEPNDAPDVPSRRQPALVTQRLQLRPVEQSDVDALWALWIEPEVRRFLWDDRMISPDDAAATVNDCLSLRDAGLGLWMLDRHNVLEGAGRTIGCAGLLPVSAAVDVPNVASDRMRRRAGFAVLGETPGLRHRLRTYLLDL